MTKGELKEKVKAQIEEYHQANFWNCFPAGTVNDWVFDAIIDNVLKPLTPEILKDIKAAK